MPYWFICVLVIALSLAWLVYFSAIAVFGVVEGQETNQSTLILEITLFVELLIIGVWSLIRKGR